MPVRIEDFMAFPDGKLYGYFFGHSVIAEGTPAWTEQVEIDWETRIAKSAHNTYELGSEYNIELETLEWPR